MLTSFYPRPGGQRRVVRRRRLLAAWRTSRLRVLWKDALTLQLPNMCPVPSVVAGCLGVSVAVEAGRRGRAA